MARRDGARRRPAGDRRRGLKTAARAGRTSHAHRSAFRLDQRTKARRRGQLPRLDARRFRFLPHGVRAQGHRHGIRHRHHRRHLRHPADFGDAPGRRLSVRPRRRPLGPPADLDGRRAALFGDRIRLRLRAEPDGAARPARHLRHRHGRRMGRRRFADHGIHSAEGARLRVGPAAIRLSGRLFPRLDRLWPAVSIYRLARHVHGRRHSGAAGLLYPAQRSGIAELEADAPPQQYLGDRAIALAARHLCRAADDGVQLLQPRHAGSLSDLPAGPAPAVAA